MSGEMDGGKDRRTANLKEDLMEMDRSPTPPQNQPGGNLESENDMATTLKAEAVLPTNEQLMKKLLKELLEEEQTQKITLAGLIRAIKQVGEQIREKESLALKLARRVTKLKERGQEDARVLVPVLPGVAWKSAVARFPEEVWKIIFSHLTDMKDLVNCSNASPLFHEILLPTTSAWLLESTLPHFWRHLPGNKLLDLRLVSKAWKGVIDGFLENHPSLQPNSMDSDPRRLDFVYPVKELGICGKNELTFTLGQDLSFLEGPYFQSMTNQNPFIGRYLVLNMEEPRSEAHVREASSVQWWNMLYKFLQAFGSEVWYLSVAFPCPFGSHDWDSQPLLQFVTIKLFPFFPNLRKLTFGYVGWDPNAPHDGWFIDEEPQPPQLLPKLESFECADGFDDPNGNGDECISGELLMQYYRQLRKLQLKGRFWVQYSGDWPNLVELHLTWDALSWEWEQDYFRILRSFKMPNLSKLTLDTTMCNWLYHLLKIINELAKRTQLKTLRIVGVGFIRSWIGSLEGDCHSPDSLFAPPTLTTLEIVDPHTPSFYGPTSYDFLLRFPFLENVNVVFRKGRGYREDRSYLDSEISLLSPSELGFINRQLSSREERVVHVNQYLLGGEMYKSNVWELLPRLKVFTFQWDVYDRAGYEAYGRKHGGVAGN